MYDRLNRVYISGVWSEQPFDIIRWPVRSISTLTQQIP